ncbi:5-carboxymethyl-2-hydroxymuconate Delta-isomerase [Nonomuraea endophytica]|uniref:5-carboxymethyl-2-hydroxymuconate isomerase n=1 Tax=Nonomuraea endophytica TaxID=714136 RepID=A0A7W8ABD2_9ACTN|nr:isomerase [Nonomuraea endophytica]MBB5081663.1 5-carboxymethyl-2-hydroxymuconate isomerase [Nonomuraea endophytica]
MPQVTVEYSAVLREAFDRRAFALALHEEGAAVVGGQVEAFKSRFYRIDDGVIAGGDAREAMVHAAVAILPGREEEVRRRLAQVVVELLGRHVRPVAGIRVQLTAEVRELEVYHKVVLE